MPTAIRNHDADDHADDHGHHDVSAHERWPHDDVLHAWWVEPGILLAGEHPGDDDGARVAHRLDLLVAHGVRTFVDLTAPTEGLADYTADLAAIAELRRLDLRHLRHPIPDFDVTTDAGYDAILATISEATGRGAVYVHCWGGVGRTGTVVACHLIAGGMSFDGALTRLAELRAGTRKGARAAPETPAQFGLLCTRAAARSAPPEPPS